MEDKTRLRFFFPFVKKGTSTSHLIGDRFSNFIIIHLKFFLSNSYYSNMFWNEVLSITNGWLIRAGDEGTEENFPLGLFQPITFVSPMQPLFFTTSQVITPIF